MKKYLMLFIFCILFVTLVACSNSGQGTYYPDSSEMQKNLEDAGYQVSVTTKLDNGYTGTYLSAMKADDYIEFYWLDEADNVDDISEQLKSKHGDYDKLVSMEDDSKFGSLVFCGTASAVDASGIVIVDVKVDVK